jgi:hypothetical protein
MATFLDTTALVDSTKPNAPRHEWCVAALDEARQSGAIIISDIVYSEFSAGMPSKDATDAVVAELALERLRFTDEALFRAGQAYKQYRQQHGGQKTNVLSDFLVGAQAEVSGAPLLTANPRDYVNYFPGLMIIQPEA